MALCLYKSCLNAKMLFESLMKQSKKDGDDCYTSLTQFFMSFSQCDKESNRYYSWKCVHKKCKECKDIKLPCITCQDSEELATVDQFKVATSKYKKVDKVSGEEIEKKSSRTERVSSSINDLPRTL